MINTEEQFDQIIAVCRDIYAKKLHDYGAAWRIMRPSSVMDQVFIKANRSIEIKRETLEGIDNMINYAIFGLIKIDF